MTISMYSASVPIFTRQLTAMLSWLDKAQAHAEARKFDPANFLIQRLAVDMLTLAVQIRIAGDTAKGCAARLAGVDIPKYEDNETSLDDFRARIRKTIDFINSVPAESISGSEDKVITLPRPSGDPRVFSGEVYLKHFALPNFFFHCTMAYALLRQSGVDVGKMDFLGAA